MKAILRGMMPILAMALAIGLWGGSTLRAEQVGNAQQAKDQASDEAKDSKDSTDSGETEEDAATSGATFFPGVRGISGKELERIIREREEREKEKERRQRRQADTRREEPASTEPDKPKAPEKRDKPAPPRTEPAAKDAAAKPDAPAPAAAQLSKEDKEFLQRIELAAMRAEFALSHAPGIRTDAEEAAHRIGNEAYIQYLLQFTDRRTDETRTYQRQFMLPLAVYRYVFDQVTWAVKFSRKAKPDEFPAEAEKLVEAFTPRLKTGWRDALLPAAELYTKVRELGTAGTIYAQLLKEFPKDKEVAKSYAAFVAIRDAEKPSQPPGASKGGGRRYRDSDTDLDADGDGTVSPQERYNGSGRYAH